MMLRFSLSAGGLALIFAAGLAQANDAVSGYPAGSLMFEAGKDVSIAREDIDLSAGRVHVRYVFASSAASPVVRTLKFALPKMPQDDSPDSLTELAPGGTRDTPQNYMAFHVSVDGQPIVPEHHEFAWSGIDDLTADLLKMGVPVFAADEDAREKLAHLPDKISDELAMRKLISGQGDGIIPLWEYQSVYEWQQSFAPGKTEVDITYTPILGYPNDMDPRGLSDDFRQAYCVPETFQSDYAHSSGLIGEVALLGYSVDEGSGAIGEFRLTVGEGPDTLASLCVPAGLTATDKPMQWAAKDFILKSDVKVLFLVP